MIYHYITNNYDLLNIDNQQKISLNSSNVKPKLICYDT